jgi:DNA-directed RNA polymerase specialized sigma24 family protein
MAPTARPASTHAHEAERSFGGPMSSEEIGSFYQELFLPLVRRGIRKHYLSNEDARDVVQEAFAIAIVKMGAEGNAHAWLKQVVDFLAVNLKRTASRRAHLLAEWMPATDQDRGSGPGAPAEEI